MKKYSNCIQILSYSIALCLYCYAARNAFVYDNLTHVQLVKKDWYIYLSFIGSFFLGLYGWRKND